MSIDQVEEHDVGGAERKLGLAAVELSKTQQMWSNDGSGLGYIGADLVEHIDYAYSRDPTPKSHWVIDKIQVRLPQDEIGEVELLGQRSTSRFD